MDIEDLAKAHVAARARLNVAAYEREQAEKAYQAAAHSERQAAEALARAWASEDEDA